MNRQTIVERWLRHIRPDGSFRYTWIRIVDGSREEWRSICTKARSISCQTQCIYIYIFIHLTVCLTKGPKPLPNRALHIVRSRASSFKWEYPLLSVQLSSSYLHLLPCLPVTSIPPFIFPSITRCTRQFLRQMWPIQLAFHFLISCRIFLYSLTLSNTSSFLTWPVQLIFPSFSSTTFQKSGFIYKIIQRCMVNKT